MSDDGEWEDDEDLLVPEAVDTPIDTPTGAGTEDSGDEPAQLLHVTSRSALTGHVVYTREYVQSDSSLSVGHFIGIAKQHLTVKESRMSLVVGEDTLQASMVASKVFLLNVVRGVMSVHDTLIMNIVLLPD